ncbi:MAG: hypothetical protein L6Q97_25470 [Thermoanaerobaculia bacterium]|nr:hypothetical protein [Thermoanaerobaculia bacterium]
MIWQSTKKWIFGSFLPQKYDFCPPEARGPPESRRPTAFLKGCPCAMPRAAGFSAWMVLELRLRNFKSFVNVTHAKNPAARGVNNLARFFISGISAYSYRLLIFIKSSRALYVFFFYKR